MVIEFIWEVVVKEKLKADIHEHIEVFHRLREEALPNVIAIAKLLRGCLDQGKKILIAGNGGSAADAQHFAAELIGRYLEERRALAAIALTTDTSILTAVGNDYGFDEVFSRQIDGLGCEGDVFIGISTSGNSTNLVKAFDVARERKVVTVALVGKSGGVLKEIANHVLLIPSSHTPRIQEAQEWVWHTWCELIDCMGHK